MGQQITLTQKEARRLAVAAQGLAGPRAQASKTGIVELLRRINCLQIDPIRAVERTQLLVLWSRMGIFDPSWLDELQRERVIIEGDAHRASYVLTEDYPFLRLWIRKLFERKGAGMERARAWMGANGTLRDQILGRLGKRGPLPASAFADLETGPVSPSRWASGKATSRMLDLLCWQGVVMCVGREGNHRLWHLRDVWMADWAGQEGPAEEEVVGLTCQRSLKALGVANQRQISRHFLRNRYPNLKRRLAELMEEGIVLPAQVIGDDGAWEGEWYLHRDSLPLLASIQGSGWTPRTVFLSPFDNLICDRERTERLFAFHFRIEIYVPKAKREYGYYVMPLLHGDRFIGRMDSKLERKTGIYHIHALYPEEDERNDAQTGAAVADSIRELAQFIGAKRVKLGDRIPAVWRTALDKEVTQGL